MEFTTVNFDIIQPGAADFMDQIIAAKAALGDEILSNDVPLFLEIVFKGYMNDTEWEDLGGQAALIAGPYRMRLARPFRNIYTYSFSMNPINVEPSGNLDFSQIQSDKTNIEVNLDTTKVNTASNTYALHMYYTGYQTFIFEEGRIQPVAY